MQIKSAVLCGLWGILALIYALPPAVRADDAHSPSALYGHWRNPKTGDSYRFQRNGTYVFRAGPQKRKSGNLSHGGTWTIYDPNPASPLGFTPGLRLRATHRQVLVRGQVVNRPAHRVFELLYQRAYLNIPRNVQVYLSKNGHYYYRQPNNPQIVHWLVSPYAANPNRLFIGEASFVRVK
jgi:hypothetical protein